MEAMTLFISTSWGDAQPHDVQAYTLWGDPCPSVPAPLKIKLKTAKRSKRPKIRNAAERQWLEACWREDREAAAARKILRQLGSPVVP